MSRTVILAELFQPSPLGGWNTRDSHQLMSPNDAVRMDNWIPRDQFCEVRQGFVEHTSSGIVGEVQTLPCFEARTSKFLLACADNDIFDITGSGAAISLSAAASPGPPVITNNIWSYIQYDDAAGGARLALVNGVDQPLLIRDNAGPQIIVSDIDWPPTGASALVGAVVYKNRVYYWELNGDSFFYTATNAIGGALTEFPLGRVSGTGGDIASMNTWTLDGGENLNDLLVIIMTSGDVIIYNGDDPNLNFSLQGIYKIGRPVNERTSIKLGGDLLILTEDGLIPLSENLITDRVVKKSISDKIDPTIKLNVKSHSQNDGWRLLSYPRDNLIILNVPISPSIVTVQYVMNTRTGAWCRFTGILTQEWGICDGSAYFAGSGANAGKVYELLGKNDDGLKIVGDLQAAWNSLQSPGVQKRMTAVEPTFEVEGTSLSYGLNVQTDFNDGIRPITSGVGVTSGTPWGSPWSSPWSSSSNVFISEWNAVEGIGFSHSVRVVANSSNQNIRLHSLNYLFENGGFV